MKNAYPERFLDSVVHKFISSITSPRPRNLNQNPDQNTFNLVLPYFGRASVFLRKKIRTLSHKYNINCKVIFKPYKVGSYFSLKSRCPKLLASKVVYNFTCSVDRNVTYVGKTKRHLLTRIREHTRPTVSVDNQSAIFNHILECNCNVSESNFKILHSCTSDYDLGVCEALIIRDLQPSLNCSIVSQGQSLFLKL